MQGHIIERPYRIKQELLQGCTCARVVVSEQARCSHCLIGLLQRHTCARTHPGEALPHTGAVAGLHVYEGGCQ